MSSVKFIKIMGLSVRCRTIRTKVILVRQGLTKEEREDEKKKISTHTFLLLNCLSMKPKSGSGSRHITSEELIVELASLTLSSETRQNEINR